MAARDFPGSVFQLVRTSNLAAIMSNIKKKKKKAKGGEGEGGGDNGSVEESRTEERVMEGGRGGVMEGGRGGGLRGFVRSMEGQSHRMVEMRLAVVAACSVAFRVLLYHDLEGGREGVAWAALSLVAGEKIERVRERNVLLFPSVCVGCDPLYMARLLSLSTDPPTTQVGQHTHSLTNNLSVGRWMVRGWL